MQIRSRLTLQFSIFVASILFIAFSYIYFEVRRHLVKEHFNIARSKAIFTASLAISRLEQPTNLPPYPEKSSFDNRINSLENLTVFNTAGQIVFSLASNPTNLSLPEISTIIKNKENCSIDGAKGTLIMSLESAKGNTYFIKSENTFNSSDLEKMRQTLWIIFMLTLSISAISGWFFAGRALAPINKIIADVNSIVPVDMNKRLVADDNKDELSRLVNTFNNLLERIQKAFYAQSSFLSNIAHEIKNPFTIIASQIDTNLNKKHQEADYIALLKSIREDVNNVNIISNNLMLLSQIQSGNINHDFKRFRMDELLWNCRNDVLKINKDYTIEVSMENMPGDESLLFVFGNETLIRLAVTNLVDNGCKFSMDKWVKLNLKLLENDKLILEIEDNGPGIAGDEKEMIFKPFFRSDKTKSFKGSGIGLSLVESIVQLHKFSLFVKSKKPQGTIFTLHLFS